MLLCDSKIQQKQITECLFSRKGYGSQNVCLAGKDMDVNKHEELVTLYT
jgi:hypothetical protein